MCYFMFAVTEKEINSSIIDEYEQIGLIIRDEASLVSDAKASSFYYNISNGHCACDLAVSPNDRVDEVKGILSKISSQGSFRFVIIDSECDDPYLDFEENKALEDTLAQMPYERISAAELLSRYPNSLDFDKVYNIA